VKIKLITGTSSGFSNQSRENYQSQAPRGSIGILTAHSKSPSLFSQLEFLKVKEAPKGNSTKVITITSTITTRNLRETSLPTLNLLDTKIIHQGHRTISIEMQTSAIFNCSN
jgi:sensor domain CHASE-containing protein